MILDLFKTEIKCDNYNVTYNSPVAITVKCMGYDGNPVVSENVAIYYNNNTLVSEGTTNVDGEYTTSYTIGSYGLHTFSCNGASVQVYVLRETHPVGSIYISVNNDNPSTLFGGIWEKIEGRFLLASSGTYKLGATGGEVTHKLTTSEMPSHNHSQNSHTHGAGGNKFVITDGNLAVNGAKRDFPNQGGSKVHFCYSGSDCSISEWKNTGGTTASNNATGGNGAHNNMPPYVVVSVWKRRE